MQFVPKWNYVNILSLSSTERNNNNNKNKFENVIDRMLSSAYKHTALDPWASSLCFILWRFSLVEWKNTQIVWLNLSRVCHMCWNAIAYVANSGLICCSLTFDECWWIFVNHFHESMIQSSFSCIKWGKCYKNSFEIIINWLIWSLIHIVLKMLAETFLKQKPDLCHKKWFLFSPHSRDRISFLLPFKSKLISYLCINNQSGRRFSV